MNKLISFLAIITLLLVLFYGGIIIKQKNDDLQSGLKLYFYYSGKIQPVQRNIDCADQEKALRCLEALWAGPTEKEKQKGYLSLIPENLTITNVTINNGIIELTFDKTLLSISGSAQIEGILKQLVFSLTEFPEIRAVRFKVAGQTTEPLIISGEGYTISAPIDRDYFKKGNRNGYLY